MIPSQILLLWLTFIPFHICSEKFHRALNWRFWVKLQNIQFTMNYFYDVTCRIILARCPKPEVNTSVSSLWRWIQSQRKQWIVSSQHVSTNSVVIEYLRILMELHILRGPKQLCLFRFKNARKYLTDASQKNNSLFLCLEFKLCGSETCPC